MMSLDRLPTILALFITAFCVGCGSPWAVRTLADPNPLVGEARFQFQEVTFDGVIVGEESEAKHLDDKSSDQQASWAEDKRSISEYFRTGLESVAKASISSSNETFVISPRVETMEQGTFTGVFNRPAVLNFAVVILDSEGNLVDEVTVTGKAGSTVFNPTIAQRFRGAAKQSGVKFGKFLNTRTKGR